MSLKEKFEIEILNAVEESKKIGYHPSRFISMYQEKGVLTACRELISKNVVSEGLFKLFKLGRLELSIEAHVIKEEYKSLFIIEEIEKCKYILEEYGYKL